MECAIILQKVKKLNMIERVYRPEEEVV